MLGGGGSFSSSQGFTRSGAATEERGPPTASLRCCQMGRRLQGKSRWRLRISRQISAAHGGGGAAEGERCGAGALVASPNQRVPVHGAGCQRLRLLSSLFPLMSVFFSPRRRPANVPGSLRM